MTLRRALTLALVVASSSAFAQQPIVLHAAHLLDVADGKLLTPGEVLVEGERIKEAGAHVTHPANARTIDLGNSTLMPGLIDAHTHLFLHPGNEGLQTVEESIPQRTLTAAAAAKADLLAGFTAERDMGTEGAKCADVAVRNAINHGEIPGPRMRVSCNAIDILGGHEDAIGFNPEQHVLSNADFANNEAELIPLMREQHKEGSDFFKLYETGKDSLVGDEFHSPYQYTEAELAAAVAEAHRMGTTVGVHCTSDPGALYAARAGVASIDHADQLSPETMKLMREKNIFAVPTFAVVEYFAAHAEKPASAARLKAMDAYHREQFKKQLAAGVPFAVGSDVGPFPHGTQAREYELMAEYGMTNAQVLHAGLINGAKLLGWADSIGQLKPGFYADIIAVPGDPLTNIHVLTTPTFVMKNGDVIRDK
ncbi:amidohydrolase family protein [Granulicella cerasi]|uniref:Amidohydrolase family protein n=1 Tax=Granulicella cerasi TaxID=741063 RepID=A0ABW1ZEF7_9BACT|nr:amidohydrolase family protein [Granulicella cerasi]